MITVKVKVKEIGKRGRPKTLEVPYDHFLRMIKRRDGRGVNLRDGKRNEYVKGGMVIIFP